MRRARAEGEWRWWELDRWLRYWRHHGTAWSPPQEHLLRACYELHGITEPDIRDCRERSDRDAVTIRLWNHRRLTLDGLTLITYKQRFAPLSISGFKSSGFWVDDPMAPFRTIYGITTETFWHDRAARALDVLRETPAAASADPSILNT